MIRKVICAAALLIAIGLTGWAAAQGPPAARDSGKAASGLDRFNFGKAPVGPGGIHEPTRPKRRGGDKRHGAFFTERRRKAFISCHALGGSSSGLPPGLQRHLNATGHLPPGLEMQAERGHFPPGLAKRWQPVGPGVANCVGRIPSNTVLYRRNKNLLLVDQYTNAVLDVMSGVF